MLTLDTKRTIDQLLIFILRRHYQTVIVVIGVVLLLSFMMTIIQGAVAQMQAPKGAKEEMLQKLREKFHLDKPFFRRFWIYLKGLPTFAQGDSFTYNRQLLDIISQAGGFKENAADEIFVLREGKGEAAATIRIDLEDLTVNGNPKLNIPLQPGDVINIPSSGKVFVGGAVVKPGGFPFKGKKLTVSQAIALTEGLKPESNASEARIYRYSGKGDEKEAIPVDILSIQEGLSEDPYLQEGDILIVPTSAVKNFLIVFRDSIKGFLNFGFWLNTNP